MAGERTYLDYNATAPVLPGARDAALRAIETAGNPSSVHAEGRAARALVEEARRRIAALAGVAADRVIFTSGGTEAAALALQPAATGRDNLLFLAAGEHPCVLHGHGFDPADVRMIPLLADGRLDLAALESATAEAGARKITLVLQAANNETGVLQPVRAAADMMHAQGGTLVCDAVQVAGRMDCAAAVSGADLILLSGHKMGGLKGAGALVCRTGLPDPAAALLRGGGQEKGLRAGTENVAAIAAFGAASLWAQDRADGECERLGGLRDAFEEGLAARFADAVIFGQDAERLPNTSAFAIPGIAAETLLMALDLSGIAVSSGSACSSGKVKASHVLEAMGVEPQVASCAIRVSLGHGSAAADTERLLEALETNVERIRTRRMASAA